MSCYTYNKGRPQIEALFGNVQLKHAWVCTQWPANHTKRLPTSKCTTGTTAQLHGPGIATTYEDMKPPAGLVVAGNNLQDPAARAEPWVGSTVAHSYLPTSPPSILPSNVCYPGPTPIGDGPAVVTTAPVYPENFCRRGLLIVRTTALATTLTFSRSGGTVVKPYQYLWRK